MELSQWAFPLVLLAGAYLLSLAVAAVLSRLLARKYHSNHWRKAATPLRLTLFFTAIYYGHPWALSSEKLLSLTARLSQIGLAIGVIWLTSNLVDIFSLYLEKRARNTSNKLDDVLVPLFKSFGKLVVFFIGVVSIGHALTIDVKSMIAGLGIGGIALALAAKDTLSNLFCSVAVILDRPFEIGDWVRLEDGVEGTVMRVGFRSTRIRTFYDSEVAIPNNKMGNIYVDNYGRRKYRRFSCKLGIQYDTPPEKIEAFCEGIRKLILERPHTRKDYFHVYLNEMADSSLNILLYVFWEVVDWSQELTERHRLLVDILRLADTIGVEFAFPTQTLHLYNENKSESRTITENFHETGQKLARDILQRRISPLTSRSSLNEIAKPPLD